MTTSKAQAKEKIKKLIEKYERVKKAKQIRRYDESNTRKDFIMPLFQALGWDTYNEFTDREVVEEETAVKGWVDYSFRINNIPQFLLEAKALKVDLDKVKWAKQAVTYGWNKGIPWVVLTDFEGLKLFNSEWLVETPHPNLEFTYDEFLTHLDDLWFLSKPSIEKGELDKQAEKWGIKAKRLKVSEKLATDLLKWRGLLYNVFRPFNKDKSEEDINESVQRVLDRLIFIRVCEDRQLEEKILWQALQKWINKGRKPDNFMKELKPIFEKFDDEYNSNLFQPHLCERLDCYGEPFEKIIEDLYADKEKGVKYDFSAIPADVLGSIYEQYLGYIQEKGTVNGTKRKKHGIYYTPEFIVDYIVQNTLGKASKEKSQREVKNIKVVDPACGSGSFLIKAFAVLDKHLKGKKAKKDAGSAIDAVRKFNILKNNIYGVDLDSQAIEIARLNLLLKALEPNHKLPMLSDNTKVGNSLVFSQPKTLKKHFGENWKKQKPFDWKNEFPKIFKDGGFDVVIGNPPYIDSETMTKSQPEFRKYCTETYLSAKGNWDLFCVFIEKGLNLLKDGGYFGMIVPNKLLSADYAKQIREILEQYKIISIRDYSTVPVFEASVYPIVIIVKKESLEKKHKIIIESFGEAGLRFSGEVLQEKLKSYRKGWQLSFERGIDFKFLDRNKSKIKQLKEICEVHGAATVSEAYEIKKILKEKNGQKNFFKFINTGTIDRYLSLWNRQPTRYLKDSYNKPIVLKKDLKKLLPRRNRDASSKKIIVAGVTKDLQCILDKGQYLAGKSTSIVISRELDPKIVLAILNSKLMTTIYKKIFRSLALGGGYLNVGPRQLSSLPIIVPSGKTKRVLIKTVDKMLNLNESFQKCSEDSDEYRTIQGKIEKVDKQINQLVYKLYNLTPEEIEMVEEYQN